MADPPDDNLAAPEPPPPDGVVLLDLQCLTSQEYEQLRRLAHQVLRQRRTVRNPNTTSLVHEAFLRLTPRMRCFQDRKHLVCLVAKVMRSILVDHARRQGAAKRGGARPPERLDAETVADPESETNLPALDGVLERLANVDKRKAQVVELRFFAGCTLEEVAETLGASLATVKREWALARAWLYRALVGNS